MRVQELVLRVKADLQKASKLDNTPSQTLGIWFYQTHLVHVHSQKALSLNTVFAHHHTSDKITVIYKANINRKKTLGKKN